MKLLKIVAILLTGFTIGEFITMWRMQPEICTFKEFVTKRYPQEMRLETAYARNAIDECANGDREKGKAMLKKSFFGAYLRK